MQWYLPKGRLQAKLCKCVKADTKAVCAKADIKANCTKNLHKSNIITVCTKTNTKKEL